MCLENETGVFGDAIWQQCCPWARAFLNRKKLIIIWEKKKDTVTPIIYCMSVSRTQEVSALRGRFNCTQRRESANRGVYVTTSVLHDNRLPKLCSFPLTRLVKWILGNIWEIKCKACFFIHPFSHSKCVVYCFSLIAKMLCHIFRDNCSLRIQPFLLALHR